LVGFGNGGSIRLVNQGGRVDVEQVGALDVSVNAGASTGNGGNIFIQGTGIKFLGDMTADGKGNGSGGNIVGIATLEALSVAQGSLGTSYISGNISANGSGTGGGGLITMVSGDTTTGLSFGSDIKANAGAQAGAGASGGTINLFTGANTFSNTLNIQANGTASAAAGNITIATLGEFSTISIGRNGIALARNIDETAAIIPFLDNGVTNRFDQLHQQ
jgi:hypothetical protein